METRAKQLKDLQIYVQAIDKELTMILQRLQWDRRHLFKKTALVSCKYNTDHKIPLEKRDIHEHECFLKSQGYSKADVLLPDPADSNSKTVVKLDKLTISQIIYNASGSDPLFKKVPKSMFNIALRYVLLTLGHQDIQPMTLDRLQTTYTADERRAIHNAVVCAVPSCHNLADLALPSVGNGEQQPGKSKSRMEILAELRDMKRRRVKYRVAAKTKNYSDVLRDIIKTQMELGIESTSTEIKIENCGTSKQVDSHFKHNDGQHDSHNRDDKTDKHVDKKEKHRDRAYSKESSKTHARSQEKHDEVYRSRDNMRASTGRDTKTKYYDADRRKRDKERDRYMDNSKEKSGHYRKSHGDLHETRQGNSTEFRKFADGYRSRDKYTEKYTDRSERTEREEKHKSYYEDSAVNDNKKRRKYN